MAEELSEAGRLYLSIFRDSFDITEQEPGLYRVRGTNGSGEPVTASLRHMT